MKPNTKLRLAINNGDLAGIKQSIADGADIDFLDCQSLKKKL